MAMEGSAKLSIDISCALQSRLTGKAIEVKAATTGEKMFKCMDCDRLQPWSLSGNLDRVFECHWCFIRKLGFEWADYNNVWEWYQGGTPNATLFDSSYGEEREDD